MYMHVSIHQHRAGGVEAQFADFENRILPSLRQQDGFQGAELLIDGPRMVVTNRWDTMEQAEAARKRAKRSHAERDETIGHHSHVGEVKTFPVDGANAGAYGHASIHHHQPGGAASHLADFEARILNEMRQQPGFTGAEIVLEDDKTVIASRWATEEQANAARGRAKAQHGGRQETKGHYAHVGALKTYPTA